MYCHNGDPVRFILAGLAHVIGGTLVIYALAGILTMARHLIKVGV